MDAAEHDLDAKLYKASGTLLDELKVKLPLLLCHPNTTPPKPRLRVLDSKCEELRALLDRFQEWPQLLDSSLAPLVQGLADAFVGYMATSGHRYSQRKRSGDDTVSTSPLPRAVCRLVYSFCKVRGYKVIVRLLNNEPRYLVPMLESFQSRSQPGLGMTWEERYVMLLWLSHLMLAPFELANMSIDSPRHDLSSTTLNIGDLPGIAADVVPLAFDQLERSGKEQQTAAILLVRLCLRKDMQQYNLHGKILKYAIQTLLYDKTLVDTSPYRALGLLSLLFGILNSASDSEIAPYLEKIAQAAFTISTSQTHQHNVIRGFAPARKLLLKIIRVVLTHGISASQTSAYISDDSLNSMLEDGIQYFLDGLGDKDTPVRMTAAKALSIIALKLDTAMSGEVIEAVLATLEENVFLEDPHTRKLIALTDRIGSEVIGLKRNINAVDPLKWHGLMLALGHFLFRRSPPPTMLTSIIQALILGLEFEQRSNVGTSVGVGVRDAACFGLWSVARKYSTAELAQVHVTAFAEHKHPGYAHVESVLQLLACKLAISACSDPSGNIRRGSSAALQELIGRHPDTIREGISIVQIIDYHAVARLSRAMIEVSAEAASLDPIYHLTLFQALTEWRGSRAVDANQRRWAASTLQKLAQPLAVDEQLTFVRSVYSQLLDLKPLNVGTTAGVRHGLLLALSAGISALAKRDQNFATPAAWLPVNTVLDLHRLTGKIDGRVSADVELVMEAISTLIRTISGSIALPGPETDSLANPHQSNSWITSAWEVLSRCTGSSGRDMVVDASADANFELIKHLPSHESTRILNNWLDSTSQSPANFTSRARIRTLSLVHRHLTEVELAAPGTGSAELHRRIVAYLVEIIQGGYKIETRVDAMDGLRIVLSDAAVVLTVDEARYIAVALNKGLADYTNDQRGDIGSTMRLKTLEAVESFRDNVNISQELSQIVLEAVVPAVVKLAAEKLNNVRFRAWRCLQGQLRSTRPTEMWPAFDHLSEVSSTQYYENLLRLLHSEWARTPLLLGFVSSATAGTEDICRAACNAFVAYHHSLTDALRDELVREVTKIVLGQVAENATQDDKSVLPMLDVLCFMIDQDLFDDKQLTSDKFDFFTVLVTVQNSTSSLARIESLLNVYSRLLETSTYRASALDKLSRQLLHRWPRVRNTAADLLYLHKPTDTLADWDWNGQLMQNKPVVLKIRKALAVSSGTQKSGAARQVDT